MQRNASTTVDTSTATISPDARHVEFLRGKIAVCVGNARDATRSIIDMMKGATPDPGYTKAAMIRFFGKARSESMATARKYAEELVDELSDRRYHVVAVNNKTGTKTCCTVFPMNHSMACRNLNAFSHHPLRRMQLEQAH